MFEEKFDFGKEKIARRRRFSSPYILLVLPELGGSAHHQEAVRGLMRRLQLSEKALQKIEKNMALPLV